MQNCILIFNRKNNVLSYFRSFWNHWAHRFQLFHLFLFSPLINYFLLCKQQRLHSLSSQPALRQEGSLPQHHYLSAFSFIRSVFLCFFNFFFRNIGDSIALLRFYIIVNVISPVSCIENDYLEPMHINN